jgi:GTPase Era involved in 16S rRNA processing
MNIDINRILQISNELGFKEISSKLSKMVVKQNTTDCPLVLPLVGEFSSGKTTLINSLTDSHALETATKPTTATIFAVHFGAAESKAVVLDENGQSTEVSDIATLKNSELADKPVVTVFDTSAKVPSSIVLVDTPGLSSPDPRHRQILIDFLPQADAVLRQVDDLQALVQKLQRQIKASDADNDDAEDELDELKAKVKKLTDQNDSLLQKIADYKATFESYEAQLKNK